MSARNVLRRIAALVLRRIAALAATLVAALGLALLWQLRPPPPRLPASLADPLAVTQLERAGLLLAWFLFCLLLLAACRRSLRVGLVRGERRRATPAWLAHRPAKTVSPGPMALMPSPPGSQPKLVLLRPTEHKTVFRAVGETPRPDSMPRPASNDRGLIEGPATRAETASDERPTVSILGPLAITGAKRSRRGLRAAAVELIAYLALHPHGSSRDEVLEAIWPGADPRRSRDRLYQAVRDARLLLGDAIGTDHDHYVLDREHVHTDAAELEHLLSAADRATANPAARAELLERALALFRGEPLAGSDYRWAEGELRRLRASYIDLLGRVGRARLENGDARAALDAAERGLQIDLLNENLWRLALEAEGALGLREAVARRYEEFRRILDERLGLEPAQETRALHRRLLGQA